MARSGERSSGKQENLLERDGMITSDELRQLLGPWCTPGILDQWASRGGGPDFHKVGKRRLYAPADVKKWLADRKHHKASEPATGAA